MGWASGSYLAEDLWKDLKKFIPSKDHKKVAKKIVDAFEDHDADDWSYDKDGLYYLAYPEQCEADIG